MKLGFLAPIALLAALLALSVWNCFTMTDHTDRWQAQLRQVDALAQSENWTEAAAALADSYEDWDRRQTYLHIVAEHDALSGAEAMYQRALAFAATKEPNEFRAELADLRAQLQMLAERERFSLKNIL